MNYGLLSQLAQHGRGGDSSLLGGEVAHLSAAEADLLESLGGAGTINPVTGLPEYYGSGGVVGSTSVAPPPAPPTMYGQKGETSSSTTGQGHTPWVNPRHPMLMPYQQVNTDVPVNYQQVNTNVPVNVVRSTDNVPVRFSNESGEGYLTHSNLSNSPNAPPLDSPEVRETVESFQKLAKVNDSMSLLGDMLPSEVKTLLGFLTQSPVSVITSFLGDALSPEVQTPQNISDTIAWLATPQGQASMSQGNPFSGQGMPSGFAAASLDEPFYAMGLLDRPDAEMSYQGQQPVSTGEAITPESLASLLSQIAPAATPYSFPAPIEHVSPYDSPALQALLNFDEPYVNPANLSETYVNPANLSETYFNPLFG